MSTTATRMHLTRAQQLAEAVRGELLNGCERIEIAGSVRRKCPTIGDLEFVAIAKLVTVKDLLGEAKTESGVDRILDRLFFEDRIVRHKNGDRYKCFTLRKPGVKVDLFLCTAETWAVSLMIRTGPETFSRKMVTQKAKGGWLPDHMKIGGEKTNTLYADGVAVPLATERELFKAIGKEWVDPWERR